MSLLAVKLRRDARRQAPQLLGVALTLALGIAVFGASFDAYQNLGTSYRHIYDRLGFADATVTGGDTEAIAAAVRRLDGVADVTTRVQADLPFRIGDGAAGRTLLGHLVGPSGGVNTILVQEGSGLGAAPPEGVVAERHMADHFGLGVGDRVEVFDGSGWQPLAVIGTAVSPEYLWPARDRQDLLTSPDDFGVLFAPDALVADLAGPRATHQVLVRYAPSADRPRLDGEVRSLVARHGEADVMVRAEQPSNWALQQDVSAFGQLAALFPVLFLAAGALAAYVLLGRLVRAQRGEIGMLAANGYPRRRLLLHYLGFGASAGLVGSVVGATAGVVLAVWLTRTYTSSLGIPLAVAHVHPLTPIVGVAIGSATGVAAAYAPARAATRVTPAEAMRGDAPTGVAHRSVIERVPGLRGLPVRVRLALRNVRRSPRRALSTGLGVVLAAVLVLTSLGLLDTVSLVLDEQFHHVQRQDAQLYLAAEPDAALLARVAGTNGVAAVEPALEVPVVLSNGERRYQTSLTGFAPDTTMHAFPQPLPDGGVLLGDGLRGLLGIRTGDTVDVTVGDAAPVGVTVAGFVTEPLGSLAYTTLDRATTIAGGLGASSVLVRYAPGADRDTLRDQLAGQPGVVAFRDARASEETVRALLGFFYAIVGVMLVFGSILAFVVLFNTLSVNLSERTVELATLRAAGGRIASLARLSTGENLVLVLGAIPVGLAAGWLTARWLMRSFNTDLYHFALRLRPATPLLLAATLVLIALSTHVPARRYLRRLDVARVVRERAL